MCDADVIEFARREIAATVGLGSRARFFLAGGAFKTLLTGHAPHDLDLWAASPGDRNALIGALIANRADKLERGPFSQRFAVAGRVVNVPEVAVYDSLESLLQGSDIAVSAVGVEYRPGEALARAGSSHGTRFGGTP